MDTLTRMRSFVAVVDNEGFSAAGRALGRSKALLSKYVRELEDELGAVLINRTTRQFSLTEAGHTYYAGSVELLRDFTDLQDVIRDTRKDIRGRIRVSAPRTLADVAVGNSLIDFAKANPDVELDIDLDDRFVDMVEEGYDLAIRITQLDDSSLIAKRLAPFRLVLCATPKVIEKYGMPKDAEDLAKLPCIVDTNARRRNAWAIQKEDGSGQDVVHVSGPISVNSPLTTRMALLSDLGFAISPDFIVADDLKKGKLIDVMPGRVGMDMGIYAVYPHRRYLPGKVRALVDFLAQWFRKNADR
ncbi:MAG: LysR family transcriptional regulator [Pseudomonadota bacterium]